MENNTQITVAQLELMDLIGRLDEFRKKYISAESSIHIEVQSDDRAVKIFTYSDHGEGLEVKRKLGIKEAAKQTYDPNDPWHSLSGRMSDAYVTIFCKGLPPMCRIETYEEEIPKTDVVTLAETIKVKRTRICCGEGK